MNNLEVYEDYVKKVLNIPYCNFHNLDEKVIYEIIVGLSLMYEMYPKLSKAICMIGDGMDANDYQNILLNSNKEIYEFNDGAVHIPYKEKMGANYILSLYKNTSGLYIDKDSLMENRSFPFHISLIIGERTLNSDISQIKDISATVHGRFGIYHEFGHLLDYVLHISENEKLNKLIENHNIKEEIDDYAETNIQELVAEAFAYYIFDKRKLCDLEKKLNIKEYSSVYAKITPLILKIGKLIDKLYMEYFNNLQVNDLYDFIKKYVVDKSYKPIDIKLSEQRLEEIIRKR